MMEMMTLPMETTGFEATIMMIEDLDELFKIYLIISSIVFIWCCATLFLGQAHVISRYLLIGVFRVRI